MILQSRKKPDYFVLLSALGLSAFGLVMIASASVIKSYEVTDGVSNNFFLYQQSVSLVLGVIVLAVTSLIPYHIWKRWSSWLFIASIILLILVFIPPFSSPLNGGYRWISFWKIFFQPSEFVKLFFIIFLSSWIVSKKEQLRLFFTGFLPFLLFVSIVCGLVLLQPDMGTTSIILLTAFIMFFVAGGHLTHIISLVPLITLGAWIMIRIEPYRMQRILAFFNPGNDTLGIAYHSRQALIAIGSGGLLGLGFGNSVQKYNFLPEPMSDSIFAVIAEELGFLRTGLLLLILGYFIFRCFKIAKTASDDFGKFLALGIAVWFCLQVIVNISAMLGILPLTGIPLPFISYGGSALIANLAAVGILINISKSGVKSGLKL